MRSSNHAPVSIFLMVVSMLAVPLMAIFGIPQFAPVATSSAPDADESTAPQAAETPHERDRRSSSTGIRKFLGAFAAENSDEKPITLRAASAGALERNRPSRDASVGPTRDLVQPTSTAAASTPAAAVSFSNDAAPFDSQPAPRTETGPNPRQSLTWPGAVRSLNELGIRQFRLQPGARVGEFHFVCFFTPVDNPLITHRFEAEAAEPLQAVEDVLAQIQQWTHSQ